MRRGVVYVAVCGGWILCMMWWYFIPHSNTSDKRTIVVQEVSMVAPPTTEFKKVNDSEQQVNNNQTTSEKVVCQTDYLFLPTDRPFGMTEFQRMALTIDLCTNRSGSDIPLKVVYMGHHPQQQEGRGLWWSLFDLVYTPTYINACSVWPIIASSEFGHLGNIPDNIPPATLVERSPIYQALFLPHTLQQTQHAQQPQQPQQRGIPRVVHLLELWSVNYTYPFWKYLNLLSIIQQVKPDKIIMHVEGELQGPWWKLARGLVELSHGRKVDNIFGNPVGTGPHKSDVLRLEILLSTGGMYLDSDTLVLKPLDPLLNLGVDTVAVWETPFYSLANGILFSTPNSPFLRRWYAMYRYFNDSCWVCHSVRLGGVLAQLYPSEIYPLPESNFLRPSFMELDQIYLPTQQPVDLKENYGLHLWYTHAWNYLEKLKGIESIEGEFNGTTYARAVHMALKDSPHFQKLYSKKKDGS